MNQVIIINGKPRVGKDTFVEITAELLQNTDVISISTVDCVRHIMKIFGINTEHKTAEIRNAMSYCKDYLSLFDVPNKHVMHCIMNATVSSCNPRRLFFIHCREPHNIDRLRQMLLEHRYTPKTLCITRDTSNVEYAEANNHSDHRVLDYLYDDVISNDGTIEQYREKIKNYIDLL